MEPSSHPPLINPSSNCLFQGIKAKTRQSLPEDACFVHVLMVRNVHGQRILCRGHRFVSRMQALDTIANNLANTSTVGYRAEHSVFSSVLASKGGLADSPLNQAINNYGIMSGTTIDQSQGALQKTGNELDLGIEGPGYFAVQTANGPMYTRNGAFQVSSKGQLVTAHGDAVMGDKGVITMPPGVVSISPDGTISSNGALTAS